MHFAFYSIPLRDGARLARQHGCSPLYIWCLATQTLLENGDAELRCMKKGVIIRQEWCLLTLCGSFLYECSFVLLETDEIIAVLMHPLTK